MVFWKTPLLVEGINVVRLLRSTKQSRQRLDLRNPREAQERFLNPSLSEKTLTAMHSDATAALTNQ